METLAWIAFLLLVGWRLERQLERFIPKEAKEDTSVKIDPMPTSLWLQATRWDEEWARKQAVERLHELYAEYGDWEKVAIVFQDQGG